MCTFAPILLCVCDLEEGRVSVLLEVWDDPVSTVLVALINGANVSERPCSHFVHRAPCYIRLASPRLPPQAYITISESSPNSTHGIGSPRDSGRPLVP